MVMHAHVPRPMLHGSIRNAASLTMSTIMEMFIALLDALKTKDRSSNANLSAHQTEIDLASLEPTISLKRLWP